MTKDPHFSALENMYQAAPINDFFCPTIEVTEGAAVIEIEVADKFFHAANAVHGSVYFKMLDDAAFFAANSLERDAFVLTTSFTTYFTRPLLSGRIRSVGSVVHRSRTQTLAEAVLYDADGKVAGRGSGLFVRGSIALRDARGYAPG